MEKKLPDSYVVDKRLKSYPTEIGSLNDHTYMIPMEDGSKNNFIEIKVNIFKDY